LESKGLTESRTSGRRQLCADERQQ